jgi:iron complex outermembrane receptor protein
MVSRYSRSPRPARRAAVLPPLAAMARAAGMGLALLAASAAALPAMAADAVSATARKSYSIPAGSLGDALARFAAAAGVPLSFDPAMVSGMRSDGLDGAYTVKEGFARLLSGSGYALSEQGGGRLFLAQAAGAG